MSATKLTPIPIFTKLSRNIIRILGCNPGVMTLQGTNTYLIGSGKRRILCDTGEREKPDYIKHLTKVLSEEKAVISDIILTHWHYDHIGGVRDVLQSLDNADECCVWKHRRSHSEIDVYPEILNGLELKPLQNEQIFYTDGATLKVIHTPGHTTDHCVLFVNETNAVLSGDCVLGETTAVFEDLYSYIKSLELILKQKPSIIYPGHGNIVEDPIGKIQFYIEHRTKREAQIIGALKSEPDIWYSDLDLVKIIYAETPQQLWKAAAQNVVQHLEKLEKELKVESKLSNFDNHENNQEKLWKYLNI